MPYTGRPAELADVGRLARRLLNRVVETARTEDKPLRHLLLDHLGSDAAFLPTASATWPSYEHVNVQAGLDAWLASGGDRRHEVFGINRADLLESALADRPGRVDLAAELPRPDAGARRQLIRLYQSR